MEQPITLGNVVVHMTLTTHDLQINRLPPDTTQQHIEEILSDLMDIECIEFFNDATPLTIEKNIPLWKSGCYCKVFYTNVHPDFMNLVAQRHWQTRKIKHYFADPTEAQQQAIAMLAFFDLDFQLNTSIVDADGFTMVTSKRKQPLQVKQYEKNDFYKFQMKDNKKRKLTELQERFNQDKMRLQKLNKANLTYSSFLLSEEPPLATRCLLRLLRCMLVN